MSTAIELIRYDVCLQELMSTAKTYIVHVQFLNVHDVRFLLPSF